MILYLPFLNLICIYMYIDGLFFLTWLIAYCTYRCLRLVAMFYFTNLRIYYKCDPIRVGSVDSPQLAIILYASLTDIYISYLALKVFEL